MEDLVHDVFLRLFRDDWRVLRGYAPARGTLSAYVATIADFHVLGVFRARCHDPYAQLPMADDELVAHGGAETGLDQQVAARVELEEFNKYVRERLDEWGLALFHMLEVDNLPVVEVCNRTEMSRDAVYAWRMRFRRLARKWRDGRERSTSVRLLSAEAKND